jgi:hypothetical protein
MALGLVETMSLLQEGTTLAEVLRCLEARESPGAPSRLPSNVVSFRQERARRRRLFMASGNAPA